MQCHVIVPDTTCTLPWLVQQLLLGKIHPGWTLTWVWALKLMSQAEPSLCCWPCSEVVSPFPRRVAQRVKHLSTVARVPGSRILAASLQGYMILARSGPRSLFSNKLGKFMVVENYGSCKQNGLECIPCWHVLKYWIPINVMALMRMGNPFSFRAIMFLLEHKALCHDFRLSPPPE